MCSNFMHPNRHIRSVALAMVDASMGNVRVGLPEEASGGASDGGPDFLGPTCSKRGELRAGSRGRIKARLRVGISRAIEHV